MAKKTYFFPHDFHARHDPKLERLFLTMGYEGLGIFWCLIEMQYEQGGSVLLSDIPLYAKGDQSLCERIARVVNDFGLFKQDDMRFWSDSCVNRLSDMKDKSQKASQSAHKRWEVNANVMPTQCEGNANIREDKIREDKRKEDAGFSFNLFWDKYPKQVGMSMAIMTYRATVKTKEDFDNLMAALNNYLKSDEVKRGFVKNGSNWIEDWKGWVPKKSVKIVPAPTKPPDPEERAKVAALIKATKERIGK